MSTLLPPPRGARRRVLEHDALRGGEGADDAARIEALIAQRAAAKKAKNFAEADRIRSELASQGILLEDSPAGTTWRRQ